MGLSGQSACGSWVGAGGPEPKTVSCHLHAWAPRWMIAPPPLLPAPQPHSQLFL